MCSADNFKSWGKRAFEISTDPKLLSNPLKAGKKTVGNTMDMLSGNAGKRDEWERQRREQEKASAGAGSYSNTYTGEDGVRRTFISGQNDNANLQGLRGHKLIGDVIPKERKPRTVLAGGGTSDQARNKLDPVGLDWYKRNNKVGS